jgi:shikimate kinase
MKNLIVITGDLAAGKSTLAASLSAELKIPFVTKDSLKEIACDAVGFLLGKKTVVYLSPRLMT